MSFTHKLKTFIRRRLVSALDLSRPSSWPYISGDSFRALAQFVHDESSTFDPKEVRAGDAVFVRTRWLGDFFGTIEKDIQHPYILVSHNEDDSVTPEHAKLMEASGRIVHWFAENLAFAHERISPLPIGLQNFYYRNTGIIADIRSLQKLQNGDGEKNNMLTWSFAIEGNGNATERRRVSGIAASLRWPVHVKGSQGEYYRQVARSKFILSPGGSGEDCHRTWEALYLGAMPIVKRTPMMEYYASIGIPLFMLDSWDELSSLTEKGLEEFYEANKARLDCPAIYMEYWARLIQQKIQEKA